MTVASIQTVEDKDAFWVRIEVDGSALTPRGPYSADEAEAAATRIAGMCRALKAEVVWGATAAGARKR